MAMLVGVGVGGLRPQATRCKYSHKYSKYTADCVGLDLTLIPDSLNEDIQILVASENRIRELHNTSFMAYSSLQFLYLSNNFITYIEPGTFNAVPKLEVLDLGVNGLRAIPAELPLPLRRLYLNGNRQIDSVPLTNAFNLQYLSLAECHLSRLPAVGQLPNLLELNLTGNPLTAVSAEQLAPLCRLKTIYMSSAAEMGHYGYGPSKESTCQCHEFSYWTNKYSIHASHQPNCTELSDVEHELCLTNRSGWYDMRQSCLARTPPFSLTSTSVMTSVGLALLCAVMVVLCCLWRRSRRKRKPPAVNSSMKDDRNLTKISTVV